MSMLQEFKDFAVKGNVIDMAVGIIIGGAFTPIVKSLVSDIIMPPIGMLLGGIEFSEFKYTLQDAVAETTNASGEVIAAVDAVTINYGNFIDIIFTFLIVAFAVFMLVKGMNKLKRQEEEAPKAPTEKDCPDCFMPVPIAAKKCGHCTSSF